jgi:regulator of protease activity HflC (stomatin/prohibitin superfamily)
MSNKIQQQIMNGRALTAGTIVSVGIVLIMALVVVFNSFTVVDAGTRGVVKTFGEVTGVFEEGLHFRTPLVTSVVSVDVKTRRYESNSSAASRDLQIVTTQVVLNYHPDPAAVGTLVRDIGTDYEPKVIDPAIQESVKAATARFTAEELITQRPLVSESIKDVLGTRLIPRGIIVEDLSITEFNFSPEFSKAIEAKQVAEQDALRAERELRRVQIEAQQQVAQADAQAEARLKVAQAEAEALRLQREVISPALLQLRFIEKWDGVLPRFSAGDTGMIPLVSIPQEELQEAQSQATPTDGQPPASLEMQAPAAETTTTP